MKKYLLLLFSVAMSCGAMEKPPFYVMGVSRRINLEKEQGRRCQYVGHFTRAVPEELKGLVDSYAPRQEDDQGDCNDTAKLWQELMYPSKWEDGRMIISYWNSEGKLDGMGKRPAEWVDGCQWERIPYLESDPSLYMVYYDYSKDRKECSLLMGAKVDKDCKESSLRTNRNDVDGVAAKSKLYVYAEEVQAKLNLCDEMKVVCVPVAKRKNFRTEGLQHKVIIHMQRAISKVKDVVRTYDVDYVECPSRKMNLKDTTAIIHLGIE